MKHHLVLGADGKLHCQRRPYTREEFTELFWASHIVVQRDYETPCWEWTRSLSDKGYGQIRRHKKTLSVPRLAWEETHGPIPSDLDILHKCNNPACYRPDHLHTGTASENSIHMVISGHQRNTKLTPDDVREIRRLALEGITQRELGARFGVLPASIAKVVLRQRWRHVA